MNTDTLCSTYQEQMIDALYAGREAEEFLDFFGHIETCESCKDEFSKLEEGKKTKFAFDEELSPDFELRLSKALDDKLDALIAPSFETPENDEEATRSAPLSVRPSLQVVPSSPLRLEPKKGPIGFLQKATRWATRPQTAMAAMFVLMVGVSAVFFHRKEGVVFPSSSKPFEQVGVETVQQSAPHAPEAREEAAKGSLLQEKQENEAVPLGAGVLQGQLGQKDLKKREASAVLPSEAFRGTGEAAFGDKRSENMEAEGKFQDSVLGAPQAVAAPAPATLAGAGKGNAMPLDYDTAAKKKKDMSSASAEVMEEARTVRDESGCMTALARFEYLAGTKWGTKEGYDATLEAGRCHRRLGHLKVALSRFEQLVPVPGYESIAALEVANTKAALRKQYEDRKLAEEAAKAGASTAGAAAGGGLGTGRASPKAAAAPTNTNAER